MLVVREMERSRSRGESLDYLIDSFCFAALSDDLSDE